MHRIVITALAASALALGALGASAQNETPGAAPAERPAAAQGSGPMGHGMHGDGPMAQGKRGDGPMGQGRHDDGPRGHGKGPHGKHHGGGHSPMMMKMMFAVADADGDGEVSLEEMQEIQARIFRAMDEDASGGLTPEEIRAFMKPGHGMARGPMRGGPAPEAPAAPE